jgi:hypothetical protein
MVNPSKPNHSWCKVCEWKQSALIVIDGSVSSQGAFDDLNPMMSLLLVSLKVRRQLHFMNPVTASLVTKKEVSWRKMTVGFNSAFTAESVAYLPKFQSQYGTGWKARTMLLKTPIGDLVMMVQNQSGKLFLRATV